MSVEQKREMRNKEEEHKRESFETFMHQPMVRLGLSQIPAGEHQDALRMLLRAAFDAGFGNGQGHVVGELLIGMLKERKP